MENRAKSQREHKTTGTENPYLTSFRRHLRAERKDGDTVDHYCGATAQFLAFCADEHLPTVAGVSREHVELWLESLHDAGYRPATVRNRYMGLRAFYDWLDSEGEIERNPFGPARQRRIKPPIVEESPKDVVSREDMTRVMEGLEAESKRAARNRNLTVPQLLVLRDAALVAVLYDSGMRASELADTLTEHVNLEAGMVFIPKAKARRSRMVGISPETVRIIDRYWRRERADARYLVCGPRGKMTRSGVYWAARKVFERYGVSGTIGAHDMRHTGASHMAADGIIDESNAMEHFGWADPEMWRHYTAQARQQAAVQAHRRASPMSRLGKHR